MIRVYVAGPLSVSKDSPAPREAQLENVRRAVAVGHQLYEAGYAPFVPHIDFFAEEELGFRYEWAKVLEKDESWLSVCDAVVRLPGASDGTNRECKYAASIGVRVYEGIDAFFADPPKKGDQRFHDVVQQIARLHDQKNRDYGSDTDPFANVRASEYFGIPAWVGAIVRGHDKVIRIQSYIRNGGHLANEGLEDALMDLAVYSLISLVLFREMQEKEREENSLMEMRVGPAEWEEQLAEHQAKIDTALANDIPPSMLKRGPVEFGEDGGDAECHTFRTTSGEPNSVSGMIRGLRENSTSF